MSSTNTTFRLADVITREYLLHHRVCPYSFGTDGSLVVAVAPEAFEEAIDEIASLYHCAVTTEPTPLDEVHHLIERLTAQRDRSIELAGNTDVLDDTTADVRDLANQPPVVRFVNLLVREAHDIGASDIHLEATRDGLAVRLRLDGVLVNAPEPPRGLHHAVISRVKLLAELDIAERRRPQDGRIRVRLETRELDLRVSTVPTMFGESVVLRLLDHGGRPACLDELGMSSHVLQHMQTVTRRAHGMLLVTGPTGSGKTTTLYAALQQRNAGSEKMITVEDPVEYHLPGVTQVPVHRQVGVTFASALRSILRQDPDVVMIGEMRDSETAEIAVQAAMTGHFVFSTLHTNDAVGAIPRLLDLGIADYLIANVLDGVLAQRLLRRTCDACRERDTPSAARLTMVAEELSFAVDHVEFTRGRGCTRCRETGFRGRFGVFELLRVNDAVRGALSSRAPRAELYAIARNDGMISLRHDGWHKAIMGLTTIDEVLRVTEA